jgi:Tol biopolymer transport system component
MVARVVGGVRLLALALVGAISMGALATCSAMAVTGACGQGGPMGGFGTRQELIFDCSPMDVDGGPLYRLYRLNPDGAQQLSSEPAQNPAVAPSGALLAYDSTAAGMPNIYVSGIAGKLPHEVVSAPGGQEEPAWSPNGRLLAYVSGQRGLHGSVGVSGTFGSVYVGRPGAAQGHPITSADSYSGQPAWSPKGNRIAYATDVNGFFQVATMASDGSGQPLFLTSAGEAQWPAWSPNAEQIAYQSSAGLGTEDWIWVMGANGKGAHRVTQGSQPTWSRDGKWIAFVRKTAQGSDLWMISSGGGHAVRITDDAGFKGRPSWV